MSNGSTLLLEIRIGSMLIEGTSNVLNLSSKGLGMAFQTWAHERVPLNLQGLVLKNGGADFHLYWFVDSM